MALSWNEIKDRALKFSNEWIDETKERAEKDSFWNDFFEVFGISRRQVATFKESVKKLDNKQGFIDLFWKGILLVEHKSKGKNLDKAYEQETDYFLGLKEHELPKYILVSDFEKIKLFDLDERTEHEFHISEFYKNVKLFGFIAGYQKRTFKEEDSVNIKASLSDNNFIKSIDNDLDVFIEDTKSYKIVEVKVHKRKDDDNKSLTLNFK